MIYISNSFNVEEEVNNEWVFWLKNSLIPMFEDEQTVKEVIFTKVLVQEELGGITYSLLIKFENKSELELFESIYFSKFLPLINSKFENKFLTFRSYLEEM